MVCPKCGSDNVNVQIATETKLVNKHHGVIWWCCCWWLVMLKWIFLALPALIVKIFKPKNQKLKQKQVSICVCQNCGHNWKV